MAKVIWKFPIPSEVNHPQMELPEGAEILCVQIQGGAPYLWAKVDTIAMFKPRKIFVYGTGHIMESVAQKYIGTFQTMDGQSVFHVFELDLPALN